MVFVCVGVRGGGEFHEGARVGRMRVRVLFSENVFVDFLFLLLQSFVVVILGEYGEDAALVFVVLGNNRVELVFNHSSTR